MYVNLLQMLQPSSDAASSAGPETGKAKRDIPEEAFGELLASFQGIVPPEPSQDTVEESAVEDESPSGSLPEVADAGETGQALSTALAASGEVENASVPPSPPSASGEDVLAAPAPTDQTGMVPVSDLASVEGTVLESGTAENSVVAVESVQAPNAEVAMASAGFLSEEAENHTGEAPAPFRLTRSSALRDLAVTPRTSPGEAIPAGSATGAAAEFTGRATGDGTKPRVPSTEPPPVMPELVVPRRSQAASNPAPAQTKVAAGSERAAFIVAGETGTDNGPAPRVSVPRGVEAASAPAVSPAIDETGVWVSSSPPAKTAPVAAFAGEAVETADVPSKATKVSLTDAAARPVEARPARVVPVVDLSRAGAMAAGRDAKLADRGVPMDAAAPKGPVVTVLSSKADTGKMVARSESPAPVFRSIEVNGTASARPVILTTVTSETVAAPSGLPSATPVVESAKEPVAAPKAVAADTVTKPEPFAVKSALRVVEGSAKPVVTEANFRSVTRDSVNVAAARVASQRDTAQAPETEKTVPLRHPVSGEAHVRVENGPVAPVSHAEGVTVRAADGHPSPPAVSHAGDSPSRVSLESLGEETVRQVKSLLAGGGQRVRIRLVPQSLGELHVEVRGRKGEVSVRLVSASPVVRDVMEVHVPALREALARDGTHLSRVDVSAHMGSHPEPGGGSMGRDNGGQAHAPRGWWHPAASASRTYSGTPGTGTRRPRDYLSAKGLNLLV